ncbi:hypothetical protein COL32_10420 [Bacillus pseudomycoides]|nr:hypothetical protein COL29_20765 [Bacillus pseudomycoides]PFX45406.1 hypothetical protein COL32_10420 [Bacillus pseudomycoides]
MPLSLFDSFHIKTLHTQQSYSLSTPFDSPYFFSQNLHAIRRVLYSFDRLIAVDWDEYTREILDNVFLEEIEKENGSSIPHFAKVTFYQSLKGDFFI